MAIQPIMRNTYNTEIIATGQTTHKKKKSLFVFIISYTSTVYAVLISILLKYRFEIQIDKHTLLNLQFLELSSFKGCRFNKVC